ncbi:LPXTG cell wall anchor domain-containing protein [Streptomyces sp. NBC_01537]|uniref:LAETG motif-containing sortase-dependent surface protein n=1 Tax=Streptomyces sp. NBC_01537 TaxID=2903896 RepID=UPI00386A34B8
MNLRRTLAVTAATAALVPAALLSAAAAHADDAETTSSATATATESATESASASASASDSASASASASASDSSSPSATGSAAPTDRPACDYSGDDETVDDNLTTALSGLPSKIVAGSGWHGFTLEVGNDSDTDFSRVDLGVFALAVDGRSSGLSTDHLALQWQDPASGAWHDISLDEDDETAGYVGFTDLKAHDSFSLKIRLSVDKTAPAGSGVALSIGSYADSNGDCVYSGGDDFYSFDILAAGSDAGDGGDAEPQTGGSAHPKPAGDTEIGSLADTGSSSALPYIALAGGAAVAFGGGAMFVVRRRKSV